MRVYVFGVVNVNILLIECLDLSQTTTQWPLQPLQDTGLQLTRKCFDDLGCVENSEDWFNLIHRPVNLLPFDRDVVGTKFILYTKNTSSTVRHFSNFEENKNVRNG